MNKYRDWFETETIRKRELLENLRWYQGSEDRLEYFFKQEYQTFQENNNNPYDIIQNQVKFWRTVGGAVPRVHSGIPKLITKTVVNLVTHNGFEAVVMSGETEDTVNTERLKMLLELNDFNDTWVGSATDSSWAGYTIMKLAHDETILKKHPLIEKISPSLEGIKLKRGKIIGATFKTYIEVDKKELEIREILELVNDKLTVTYEAYEYKDGKENKVNLPKEVSSLETNYPFNFLPFELHKNTEVNSRFPDSVYGESDYTAIQSLFHMLDDLMSQSELEVSNAQAVKFVNDNILRKREDGTTIPYDANETVIIVSAKDMETFDINKNISMLQPAIRVESYEKTIKELTARILTIAGISPLSAGLPGFESVQASAQSQREREKTSLRTRKNRLDGWKITLQNLFNKLLKYDDWLNGKKIGEYDVNISFSEWAVPTLDDRIDSLVKAVQGDVMDVATAVEELYSKKSDEEKALIILAIKLESGIPLLEDDYVRAGLTPPKPQGVVNE